jgi:hypothetical protein
MNKRSLLHTPEHLKARILGLVVWLNQQIACLQHEVLSSNPSTTTKKKPMDSLAALQDKTKIAVLAVLLSKW